MGKSFLSTVLVVAYLATVVTSSLISNDPRGAGPSPSKPASHHPYPAFLLRDHEVRHSIGSYIVSGLSAGNDHDYSLRDSESFYWAKNGRPKVNYTAFADEDNVKILALERHHDVFNDAKCSKGQVVLTFDPEHFAHVQQSWSWVNDRANNKIILVTDNAECNVPDGDASLRQPWSVHSIKFDESTNEVLLAATSLDWSDAFGTDWRFQASSKDLVPDALPIVPMNRRQQLSKIKRFDIKASPHIPIAADLSGVSFDIAGPVTLSCNPCATTGEIDFDIDVVPWIAPRKLTGYFQVTPNGVSASLAAQISASASVEEGTPFSTDPLQIPIPYADISIGKLANVGLTLNFNIGGHVYAEAAVEATAGIKVTIPDSAIYYVDFGNSAKDQNTGWTPQLEPILDLSSNVAIGASIGPQISLELDAEILTFGFSAGVTLAGPSLEADASITYDPNGGVCGNPDAHVGADFDMYLGIAIEATESAPFVGAYTQTLYATSWPFTSTCLTLPGGVSTTSVPSSTTNSPPYPTGNNGTSPS